MADRTGKKKNKKDSIISVRLDAEQKKRIEKRAEKNGQSISSYVLDCVLSGTSQTAYRERISETAVIGQRIANYVEEKYRGDEILEGLVEALWKNVL